MVPPAELKYSQVSNLLPTPLRFSSREVRKVPLASSVPSIVSSQRVAQIPPSKLSWLRATIALSHLASQAYPTCASCLLPKSLRPTWLPRTSSLARQAQAFSPKPSCSRNRPLSPPTFPVRKDPTCASWNAITWAGPAWRQTDNNSFLAASCGIRLSWAKKSTAFNPTRPGTSPPLPVSPPSLIHWRQLLPGRRRNLVSSIPPV